MNRSSNDTDHSVDPIPLFYWDKKKNFGDLIGPWLVEMMTGRPTINVRGRQNGHALATVGSIIEMFDRPGLDVWGAGLMRTLDTETVARLRKRKPNSIRAVRGWRTYQELTSKLGWAVPKTYGDPALLLPEYYRPRLSEERKIVICPHFGHRSIFNGILSGEIHITDVQKDANIVVDEIASAKVCISTSLHGLIVAHAYGVPWIWLEISGQKLGGTNFKFEDFFTVLDRSAVQGVKLKATEINVGTLLSVARRGNVPKDKFSYNSLSEAFPFWS